MIRGCQPGEQAWASSISSALGRGPGFPPLTSCSLLNSPDLGPLPMEQLLSVLSGHSVMSVASLNPPLCSMRVDCHCILKTRKRWPQSHSCRLCLKISLAGPVFATCGDWGSCCLSRRWREDRQNSMGQGWEARRSGLDISHDMVPQPWKSTWLLTLGLGHQKSFVEEGRG